MSNMRIVYRNSVKRATLSANALGALVVDNLKSNDKSKFFRAPGKSVTILGTFAAPEILACAHLPHCNLSPTATIRVRLYSGAVGVGLLLDTGVTPACPAPARELEDWTPSQAASAYFNGGGSHAYAYFAPTSCLSFQIDIADPNNLQADLEFAAALVIGDYWSPEHNATDASMSAVDTTTLYRNGAGGQMADAGSVHRKMPIDLDYMEDADRTKLANLLMNSRASPILVDLLPGAVDPSLRRDHMIYGRRTLDSDIAIKYSISYGSKIEIEEI